MPIKRVRQEEEEFSPPGAHPVIGRDVDSVGAGVVFHGQAQVGDDGSAILLHQDIFGLDISVSNGRFSCST